RTSPKPASFGIDAQAMGRVEEHKMTMDILDGVTAHSPWAVVKVGVMETARARACLTADACGAEIRARRGGPLAQSARASEPCRVRRPDGCRSRGSCDGRRRPSPVPSLQRAPRLRGRSVWARPEHPVAERQMAAPQGARASPAAPLFRVPYVLHGPAAALP